MSVALTLAKAYHLGYLLYILQVCNQDWCHLMVSSRALPLLEQAARLVLRSVWAPRLAVIFADKAE